MSNSFFLRTNTCPHCGRYDEVQIGHNSAGNRFVVKKSTTGISSYDELVDFLDGGDIFDEYGRSYTKVAFLEIVKNRAEGRTYKGDWFFPANYRSGFVDINIYGAEEN